MELVDIALAVVLLLFFHRPIIAAGKYVYGEFQETLNCLKTKNNKEKK